VAPIDLASWRPAQEQMVLAAPGVRPVVIRPGVVYGGSRGIIGDLLRAGTNGLIRVVGDGRNHWACVYDRDLAELYVRLLETGDASGIFHANDEADETVGDIVDAIGRSVTHPPDVRFVPLDEARAKMGPYADALALDQRIRSPRARALGWTPALRSVRGNVPRLLEEWRSGMARDEGV
jgi:nucleoside-diphosphate-sugar epimerase